MLCVPLFFSLHFFIYSHYILITASLFTFQSHHTHIFPHSSPLSFSSEKGAIPYGDQSTLGQSFDSHLFVRLFVCLLACLLGVSTCHCTSVEIRGQLVGMKSPSTMWVSGIKLRLAALAAVKQPHLMSYLAGPIY